MNNSHLPCITDAPLLQGVEVARVYRLFSRYRSPDARSRTIATVVANSEADARLYAYESDPFYLDWLNTHEFVCEEIGSFPDDAIGDATFTSAPVLPVVLKATR